MYTIDEIGTRQVAASFMATPEYVTALNRMMTEHRYGSRRQMWIVAVERLARHHGVVLPPRLKSRAGTGK
jgi:hypothetical protein